ncbi:polysaccharide biosynthesis C-terminal domain-containing protein [Paenibacillus hexagrammi]|uniref:polysaccharide biosynthesis C-terminal domain-containing protein n=1 Tax=Paenibacillus hexagrammi TaxID=2908839 RepID=UPI00288354A0|nr:polysaccharide biosynthesis C-terminal domain-containing protein [Paenibacillus sp. YPD9-1]
MKQVSHQTSRVLQLAILSGLPAVLVISIAARPLDLMLFGYEDSTYGLAHGPHMISLLTLSAMFQITMQTSGAVLMGMGRMRPLIVHVIIGLAIKLIGSFLLAQWLGIYGITISTGLCFIVMSWLNTRTIRKEVDFTILGRRSVGIALTVIVIAAVGLSVEWLTNANIHPFAWYRMNAVINSVIVCAVAGVLYPVMLMATRVVTKEDVQNFPAPLQKLIRKAGRLMGRA